MQIQHESLVFAVDPCVVEGADDAPAKVGNECDTKVILRAMLDVAEIARHDSTLILRAEELPHLLLGSLANEFFHFAVQFFAGFT